MEYEVYTFCADIGRDRNERVVALCNDERDARAIVEVLNLRYINVAYRPRRTVANGRLKAPRVW